MYHELKSPIMVQLEITSRCNHRCIHCYNHWEADSSDDTIMKEIKLYKVMKNLKDSEVVQMIITGGEPMLYPNLKLYSKIQFMEIKMRKVWALRI